MKKVLLTLLAVILVIGALAGAGFSGYRIGFNHGASSSGHMPSFDRFERMNPGVLPHFDRDFGFRVQPYHSPMMGRGISGFNIFSPLRILWNIAVLALIVWFFVWLFTKSGWRIVKEDSNGRTSSGGSEG